MKIARFVSISWSLIFVHISIFSFIMNSICLKNQSNVYSKSYREEGCGKHKTVGNVRKSCCLLHNLKRPWPLVNIYTRDAKIKSDSFFRKSFLSE